MNELGIGVVISDADGTQVIHGERFPTPEVQASARALRANGIPLLEATGRSHALLRDLVEPLDLQNNLCVLDGGATIAHADSGEVVWMNWLSPRAHREVIARIGRLCTDPRNINFPAEMGLDVACVPSVFAVFQAEKGDEIAAILDELRRDWGVEYSRIMRFKDSRLLRCVQVVQAGVDKQLGTEQMLLHAKLADRRRLVIGDGNNDIPLFAAAGYGGVKVAMGNASEELKQLADWVAPPVEEDGFAATMEQYNLV